MLKLQQFIKKHSDWEERLANDPYNITIKRDNGLVMFYYTSDTDLQKPLAHECRGIILDETDHFKAVCVPFFRFGNYGEPHTDSIDWKSAKVQEKIDGSLIKVWYHKNEWRIGVRSCIMWSREYDDLLYNCIVKKRTNKMRSLYKLHFFYLSLAIKNKFFAHNKRT